MVKNMYSGSSQSYEWNMTGNPARIVAMPLCPDLLDYELIGAADNMRGRVVRAFFWLMRIWPA